MSVVEPFDEVYYKNAAGRISFGMCFGIQEGDEWSDEGSVYSRDDEDWEGDNLIVAWHPDGRFDNVRRQEVKLANRFFHPGEFVITGQNDEGNPKISYVKEVEMVATVQVLGTENVLIDVNVERLTRIQIYRPRDIVLYEDTWVGEVTSVKRLVNLVLVDVNGDIVPYVTFDWDDLAAKLLENSQDEWKKDAFRRNDVFYPGLKLGSRSWVDDMDDFNDAIVETIEMDSINIKWLNCIQDNEASQLPLPKIELTGQDLNSLRRLKPFDHLAVQLGSIRCLEILIDDLFFRKREWTKNPFLSTKFFADNFHQFSIAEDSTDAIPLLEDRTVMVEVLHTSTVVTAVSLEDNQTEAFNATYLTRFDPEFEKLKMYPSAFVVEKNRSVCGIMQQMDLKKHTAKVANFGYYTTIVSNINSTSLYELRPHPSLSLLPGTVVTLNNQGQDNVIFGYVVSVEGFKAKICTNEKKFLFASIYTVKPLALQYPATYNASKSQPKDRTNISNSVKPALGVSGWDSEESMQIGVDVKAAKVFTAHENVPKSHWFSDTPPITCPDSAARLKHRLILELRRLRPNHADWLKVKAFLARMDLYSVMIVGRKGTPYGEFLFFFDIWFPANYPKEPPQLHLQLSEPLLINPWFTREGFVNIPMTMPQFWSEESDFVHVLEMIRDRTLIECPSILSFEVPELLQSRTLNGIITSVEIRNQTQKARNVDPYNEALLINLLHDATTMIHDATEMKEKSTSIWNTEIKEHYKSAYPKYFASIMKWLDMNSGKTNFSSQFSQPKGPKFPLLPLSVGGNLAIRKNLMKLKRKIASYSVAFPKNDPQGISQGVSKVCSADK